ncbi:MAG: alpha/beta hydrolase [Gammaproteobacteria bacterium]|nr:alpha/beta hydrolase [Gammaproteobacteria bacterium]
MNGLISFVSAFAIGYAVLAVALFFYQPNLLYFPDIPTREVEATPGDVGLDFEPLTLTTRDNEQLDAWFVPANQARGVVLFCHGNAGNISHRLDSIRLFHEFGLSVLIFDYRGYGQSTGKPTEKGTYRDADAAWDYLVEQRGIPPEQIILFGRSLGASITADLATRQTAAGVILESAFTSVPDVAAQLYAWLPVRWLSRYQYDTRKKLANIHSPVLIVHSRDDEIIPYSNGERLFEAANEPKQFLELRGGHNDGFMVSGKEYTQGLDSFIGDVLGE